jgi:hypothetical protein
VITLFKCDVILPPRVFVVSMWDRRGFLIAFASVQATSGLGESISVRGPSTS